MTQKWKAANQYLLAYMRFAAFRINVYSRQILNFSSGHEGHMMYAILHEPCGCLAHQNTPHRFA